MTSQLRSCLLILVVLNLVFVQITGAANLQWMLPLFALAMLAPVLSPLQKYWTYQLAWNIGLLAIFGLLLKDIRDVGVRFMLEDGLILAAFCQVHVLNNLAKQKRPDLLFFNSFLIALVTGFFCQDLAYSVVFGLYAMALVISICISSAGTVAGLPTRLLASRELRPLISRSLRMGFITILLTGLVFAFWPRDFDREGLVDTGVVQAAARSQIGFADQIHLDNKGSTTKTNRVVIRAKLLKGSRTQVSEYWRGATFTNLRKHRWVSDTNMQPPGRPNPRQFDVPWQRINDQEFFRPGRMAASLAVELSSARPRALFAPLEANRLRFRCQAWPQLDSIFRISVNRTDKIRYTLDLGTADGPRRLPMGEYLRDLLRLNPGVVPPETAALDAAISRDLPSGATPIQVAETIQNYLEENRSYFLPGESGAVDNLRAFIAGKGGGHCEFFATTMVILLRKHDIPCRMVGGYHAHEWNEEENELTIRSNHAHAWVEMWRPGIGWLSLDPTPAREALEDQADTLVSRTEQLLRGLWTKVTTFDSGDREAVIGWAKTKFLDLSQTIFDHRFWFVGGLFGLFGMRRWLRLRRQVPQAPAVADYLGTLRKLGLERRPGETPRQLLARVGSTGSDLPEAEQRRLASATHAHEKARYE